VFLLVANFRGRYDLQTESQVYEWVDVARPCDLPEQHCLRVQSGFSLSASVTTQGAIRWLEYLPPGNSPNQPLVVPLCSRSALSLRVSAVAYTLQVDHLAPVPRIRMSQVIHSHVYVVLKKISL
jgi:hypothetical protein